MIRGFDMYGRDAISPREKKELSAANKTARKLFQMRNKPSLAKRWDKPVSDLTLRDVELILLEAIHRKYGS